MCSSHCESESKLLKTALLRNEKSSEAQRNTKIKTNHVPHPSELLLAAKDLTPKSIRLEPIYIVPLLCSQRLNLLRREGGSHERGSLRRCFKALRREILAGWA
jgi:hypothetical protein